jgi:RNA polymerase sigma factor (sigma-70 family)
MAETLRRRLSPSEQQHQVQLQLAMFWDGCSPQERNAYANILVFLVLKGEDVIAPAAFEVIVYDIILKSPSTSLLIPQDIENPEDFQHTLAAVVMEKLRRQGVPRGQSRPRPWRALAEYHQRNHDLCTSNFRAWIREIAKNTAIDLMRRHPMSVSTEGKRRWICRVPLEDWDDSTLAVEKWRSQTSLSLRLDILHGLAQIAGRLRLLPQKDRDVLRLRVDDGLSYRQIAALQGCTPEAVRKRLMRARRRLRQDLEDLLDS